MKKLSAHSDFSPDPELLTSTKSRHTTCLLGGKSPSVKLMSRIQPKLSKNWKQRQMIQKFPGKVSINSGNFWISEMRTIQPKILEIPGVKWNGKETYRENVFENLAIPREVDLLFGNFRQYCSIRYWKLSNIQSWRFGWMKSAQKVHENKHSLSPCDSKFAPWLDNCLFWFAGQNVS